MTAHTVELTSENFEAALNRPGTLLVDFWAGWCAPCRSFAPVYDRVAARYPDAVFGKVDVDAEPELAEKYQVSAIPTLMVVRDGVVLHAEAGALPERALDKLVDTVQNLDMDAVRESLAARTGASA